MPALKLCHMFDISAYALTAVATRLRPQLNQNWLTQQVLAHLELLEEDPLFLEEPGQLLMDNHNSAVLAVLDVILDPPTLRQHGLLTAGPVLAGATSPFLDPAPNACLAAHRTVGLS